MRSISCGRQTATCSTSPVASPATADPTVYRLPLGGDGLRDVVISGAPLMLPDGLAVTRDGEVYVAARASVDDSTGAVFRVLDGALDTLADGALLGGPAGLALTLDEGTLLVSSLSAGGTSQVLIVDLATGGTERLRRCHRPESRQRRAAPCPPR
ncbi:MAG: hypothetical protein U0531_03765 [Dehalococcoidia bacterium]